MPPAYPRSDRDSPAFPGVSCRAGPCPVGVDLDIGDQQLLRKNGGPGDEVAGRIHHKARPIEHELVLPADEIIIAEVGAGAAGETGRDILLNGELSRVVGRAGDIEGHGHTLFLPVFLQRVSVDPDILADRDKDRGVAHKEDQGGRPRREITFLVEDAVVGQLDLMVDRHDLFFRDKRRGVVHRFSVAIGKSHQGGDAGHLPGDLLERRLAVPDEVRFEDEVFRRVAAHGKLGEGHDVGLAFLCPFDKRGDLGAVAVKIAYGRIYLGLRDS